MLESWASSQVRAAEEPLLAAGEPLMERAAFALHVRVCAALRSIRGRLAGARVLVLAGSGNNGGDALYAGALLARRGIEVRAVLASDRVHAGGLAALVRAGGRVVEEPGPADLVLDGLVGIGGDGSGLRGRAAAIVDGLVGEPYVVAVDVPSGIGVDDGARAGAVLDADLTVTFGGAKAGLLLPPAARAAGSDRGGRHRARARRLPIGGPARAERHRGSVACTDRGHAQVHARGGGRRRRVPRVSGGRDPRDERRAAGGRRHGPLPRRRRGGRRRGEPRGRRRQRSGPGLGVRSRGLDGRREPAPADRVRVRAPADQGRAGGRRRGRPGAAARARRCARGADAPRRRAGHAAGWRVAKTSTAPASRPSPCAGRAGRTS